MQGTQWCRLHLQWLQSIKVIFISVSVSSQINRLSNKAKDGAKHFIIWKVWPFLKRHTLLQGRQTLATTCDNLRPLLHKPHVTISRPNTSTNCSSFYLYPGSHARRSEHASERQTAEPITDLARETSCENRIKVLFSQVGDHIRCWLIIGTKKSRELKVNKLMHVCRLLLFYMSTLLMTTLKWREQMVLL